MTLARLTAGVHRAYAHWMHSRVLTICIIEAFLASIIDAFGRGETVVKLRGFGSFRTHYRKAFVWTNPRNGDRKEVAASIKISFRPSAEFLRRIK